LSIKINAYKGSHDGYVCDSIGIKSEFEEYLNFLNSVDENCMNEIVEVLTQINGGFLEFNNYTWSGKLQNKANSDFINKIHNVVREVENINRKEAIEIIQHALRIYKIDESLMLHYFNLLLRENEIYRIIHEFEKYKKVLKDEFNLYPSIELSSFVKKVV